MDPDSDDFKLVLEFDDEDGSDWETNSDVLVTASVLESELADLKRYLQNSVEELKRLHVQSSYFDPSLPPAMGWTEEVNERDHKASIRFCEYRIRRIQAQMSNLNRKLVSAKRAEASGLHVGHFLDLEDRTLFVLGLGSDHCHVQVVKAVFKTYGEVENVIMHKRHCFVTFSTKHGANKALKINGTKPLGRRVRVRPKLEPYAFALGPLTPSYAEPTSFSFSFTFCVPSNPFSPPREIACV